MKLRGKFVLVDWDDASAVGPWDSLHAHEHSGTSHIVSSGFLINRTKHEIVIAQSVSENGNAAASLTIPAGWVKSVRVIARVTVEPRPRRK